MKPQQIFYFFKNQNILFPECPYKDQTYISDILTLFEYMLRLKIRNKCENEDNLNLFWNRPNFIRNEIIIHMLLIKVIFHKLPTRRYIFKLTKYDHEDVSESIDSDDRIFLSLVLQNYQSLNAPNFRRL